MRLTEVHIKNYRLLLDSKLTVDESVTLIVGRNNTGKTSSIDFLYKALNNETILFDDYPLSLRQKLCDTIVKFLNDEISFEVLLSQIQFPSIRFTIDYSLEQDEDSLGALSPFIIDVDPSTTTAIIDARYSFINDKTYLTNLLANTFIENADGTKSIDVKKVKDTVVGSFSKLFPLSIFAVNPKNEKDVILRNATELKQLFPLYNISAERYLDESGSSKNSTLGTIISKFFDFDVENESPELNKLIGELKESIISANSTIKDKSEDILGQLVDKSIGFGYPSAEELQLGIKTNINLPGQLQNTAELTYKQRNSDENLPSSYNGLGYKNLIKIEFELAAFAARLKIETDVCIPILTIEEPESHMHPQLQHSFANYLESFLKNLSNTSIQTIITSHSAHIANTVDFSKIRYAQKGKDNVIYKDLNVFAKENESNITFIKKYITLSRCDLFFADKAIFIEGSSERILLPDMIEKCKNEGLFNDVKPSLESQYYSIIEIGGAYAHIFIPFIQFLGIPCLILTDIDSAVTEEVISHRTDGETVVKKSTTKCLVSAGTTTTNSTLKWWVQNNRKPEDTQEVSLNEDVIKMTEENKTIGKCHIEFQSIENGVCGRSLEESIINVNRALFQVSLDASEAAVEFKDKSKTDFALRLLENADGYTIPEYIKNGLIWLNKQKHYE